MYEPQDMVKICMIRDQIKEIGGRSDSEDVSLWAMMYDIVSLILSGASPEWVVALEMHRGEKGEEENG